MKVLSVKRFTVLMLTLVLVLSTVCTNLVFADEVPEAEQWTWSDVNLNGMGWVTSVVVCPTAPYQMYARTDVGGVYRYDRVNQKWIQLMDSFSYNERGAYSVEGIAVDPNDGNTVYIVTNATKTSDGGEIWKSTDAGTTWSATGLRNVGTAIYTSGNDGYRGAVGERIVVDPNNSNVVYFGSHTNGLWRKIGNGAWQQVSGMPASTGGGYDYVVFDKTGGTTTLNGVTVSSIVYVGANFGGVSTSGVYKSTNGGASFTKMGGTVAGYQETPLRGAVNSDGVFATTVFAPDNGAVLTAARADANLTEVAATKGTVQISGLCVSTDGKSFVALGVSKDYPVFISNAGVTAWTKRNQANGTLIPYTDSSWCHPERGGFCIDPTDPSGNTAFAGTGFGVVKTVNLATGTGNVIWNDNTNGFNELCVNTIKTAPIIGGADLEMGAMDMGGFVVQDRDVVPTSRLAKKNVYGGGVPDPQGRTWYGPEWGIPLTSITGMDYSYKYPKYMAYTGYHEFGYYTDTAWKFGVTEDGGTTWNEISVPQDKKSSYGNGIGKIETAGTLALSSTNPYNIVWSPTGGPLRYTLDMGKTWAEANIDPQVYSNPAAKDNSVKTMYERIMPVWGTTQNVAADKVNGKIFYLFTSKNGTDAQFYRSLNGGKSWSMTYQGATSNDPNNFNEINAVGLPSAKVRVNPVKEGDVFVTVTTSFTDDRAFTYRPLWRSTNKTCTDFEVVPGVQSAMDVAFGIGNSADNPYIYIYGQANGDTDFGVYVSRDNGNTWTRITTPDKQFGKVTGLEADMRYKGLVYLYFGGRGVVSGKGPDFSENTTNAQAWYNWNNTYSGEKVAITPVKARTELLTNPSFELGQNGIASDWKIYGEDGIGNGTIAQIGKASTKTFSGNYCAFVSGRDTNSDMVSQTIKNYSEGEYELSAWVRLPENTNPEGLQLGLDLIYPEGSGQSNVLKVTGQKTIKADDGWVQLKGRITLTKSEAAAAQELLFVIMQSDLGTNTPSFNFYADYCSMKLVGADIPELAGELAVNPGIEQGIAPWTTYYNVTPLAVLDPNFAHSGQYYANVERKSFYDAVYQNVTSKIYSDVTYNFSAWVRLPTGTAPTPINMTLDFVNATGSIVIGTATVNSTGWTEVKGTYTVTDADIRGVQAVQYSIAAAYANNNNSTTYIQHIYVDDLSMTRVMPAPVNAESVTIPVSNFILGVGSNRTLSGYVLPENAVNKSLEWTSSNTQIATVDANGKVTALSEGTATISAKVTGTQVQDSCTVTVVPPINIALNKTVMVSSIYSSIYDGSKAVDGNTGTRWSSKFSDPQWIYVDLGANYCVNRVKLRWETAAGKTFKIQVSDDAVTWSDVYSTSNGAGGNQDIPFTGTNARYVRMYGTQRNTGFGYSLWEFEVYAENAP